MPNNSIVSGGVVTISSGGALSDAINLNGRVNAPAGLRIFGIMMPSSWTSADITFQVSIDGITYQDFYDSNGSEVTIAAEADAAYYIDPAVFATWVYVKIRSGISGTPVNQAADREITLVLRSV